MPDPRIAAAQCNARLAAMWLATCVDGDIPSKVRTFFDEDVPHLFATLHNQQPEHSRSPADQLHEAIATPGRLVELVHLVRLADHATASSPNPGLWEARESDVREAFTRLCVHRIRDLAETAVRELSTTDWQMQPSPVVPWLAPEWETDQ